jgi:GxxExxY protein
MKQNEITHSILNAAYRVHTELGPGLLESAYENCLAYELNQDEIYVETQKPLPLVYKEVKLECGYRVDLFVENEVVVEIKAVDGINDLHLAQTLTYLKLLKKEIGLILNFNVTSLKNGIKRVINSV